jgi:hypothetical protein
LRSGVMMLIAEGAKLMEMILLSSLQEQKWQLVQRMILLVPIQATLSGVMDWTAFGTKDVLAIQVVVQDV